MSKDVYCSAPWKGITIRENGDVLTCCIGKTALGNLNNQTIDDIMSSDALSKIKSDLAVGHNKNCGICIDTEKTSNYSSLRRHYLKYHPLTDVNTQELKFIDVRWNNKCNLACQYCEPTLSSTWEERLSIVRTSATKNYQDDLLQWMLNKAHSLKEIMLVGGEPMLMKQNHKLIQELPSDCQISIITNLSYDFSKLPCLQSLLDRPREKIIWNISVENIAEQYEYVRNGADWNLFLKNLKFLLQHWPNTVSLSMVYSLFCALNLDQTIEYFYNFGVKKFTLLPIGGNDEINTFLLSLEIQQQAAAVLEKIKIWHSTTFDDQADLYPIEGLQDLLMGLHTPNDCVKISREQFFNKISWYDSWTKNKKFAQLWPDVDDLTQRTL